MRKFEPDISVILECLYETYDLEWGALSQGTKFYDTIVLPFLIMLRKNCCGIKERGLHEMMASAYQTSQGKDDFVDQAGQMIQPYLPTDQDLQREEVTEF